MTDLHERLRFELVQRKSVNPRFSLRRMAALLTMSPTHLSLFLAGKKGLSADKLQHIAGVLQIPDRTIADFVRNRHAPAVKARSRKMLVGEELSVISDWYYFAILSLAKTNRNSANPASVAIALGISTRVAREALAYLRARKFISTAGGKLRQLSAPIRTEADVASLNVRAYHRRNLQLAAEKLETVPIDEREFGSITFAADERRLRALKEHVRKFLEDAPPIAENPSATRVYTLACQLFPLSNVEKKK